MQRFIAHRFQLLPLCAAAVLTSALGAASAQTAPAGGGRVGPSMSQASRDGWSAVPGTRRGYVGLNVGRSDFDNFGCGNGTFGCDDSGTRAHLYTGGLFNDWVGIEVGFLSEGKVDRGGGSTRAQGVNLSLVARAPLGAFNVFAKGGATYGRTRVSSDALSGLASGSASGWGRSLGFGVGYDFAPNAGVVLELSRHAFRVPGGGGRRDVDGASIGYIHRF